MPSESSFRFSDGIIDTKQVTKRAFDGKGTSEIPDYTWHHHQDTGSRIGGKKRLECF
ncbi:hypothetical protein [Neisseria sp. LACPHL-SPEC-2024-00856]|uniref:hypothetical protein n=1 Tax=Neisseria sp. LACPHL-SPEC-2024-00856 TaxID=3391057 RepID=UPI003A4D53BA